MRLSENRDELQQRFRSFNLPLPLAARQTSPNGPCMVLDGIRHLKTDVRRVNAAVLVTVFAQASLSAARLKVHHFPALFFLSGSGGLVRAYGERTGFWDPLRCVTMSQSRAGRTDRPSIVAASSAR